MLFFGHIGITAGVVKGWEILASINGADNGGERGSGPGVIAVPGMKSGHLQDLFNWIKQWSASIDYRLVLVGSFLPDLIDKPVWFLLAQETSISGRGYAHTLLFNLVLFAGVLILIRYGKSWWLVIAPSSFMHLVLDEMWNSPVVLLWPLFGPLPEEETADWVSNMLWGLLSQPAVYIPEIVGLVIVSLFTYSLVKRRNVLSFLKNGTINLQGALYMRSVKD